MPLLHCDIVTPEAGLFSEDVKFVVLPAANGEMGIYAMHEPVVTTLRSGLVRITLADGGEPISYIISGGYAQIDGKSVLVLSDRAAGVKETDKTQLQVKIETLEEKLADMKDDDPEAAYIKDEIQWYQLLVDFE